MGSRRGHVALAAVLLAAAVGASAAFATPLRVLMSRTPNKTESNRTAKVIDGIVIHDTEGRFVGSVRALQNPRAAGSAHFVVSRSGQVVQLVPVTDVAWHAGNGWWNLHAIGIEHEGWADRRSFTEKEYRASAKLVAYLAHRWGIPLDRDHIIGHGEVPDPYHPRRSGGVSHHYDPGPHWQWAHYMELVRWYSAHPVLPDFVRQMSLHDSPKPAAPRVVVRDVVTSSTPVRVTAPAPPRSTVDRNATVRGKALWWSGVDASRRWRKHIWKVDFVVDGKTLYTDHTWPYSFHRTEGWDTRTVANGSHMLVVKAYGTHHYRASKRVPVRVENPPMRVTVTGVAAGAALRGEVVVGAQASEQVERVALYVDGRPVSRDASAPYALTWDTASAEEGSHSLLVYARGRNGRRAAVELPVVVANNPTFPSTLVAHDAFGTVSADG